MVNKPVIFLLSLSVSLQGAGAAQKRLDDRAFDLLSRLCRTLRGLQHKKESMWDPFAGAIRCPAKNPVEHGFHTRAGEAVFPFALLYHRTGKHLSASCRLGDWLVEQQQPDGSWLETPHHWQGTTPHQLLALAAAYKLLGPQFKHEKNKTRRIQWLKACREAADFVVLNVKPGHVPLSYLPTAACALKLTSDLTPSATWEKHASYLINATLEKRRIDGLLTEEKSFGVDPGLSLGQTIPMLALYISLTGKQELRMRVLSLAERYLKFLWPDGSIDAAWGTRMNRWILWGSFETYGAIAGFALLSDREPYFRKAAERNLDLLFSCLQPNGLIGYGPDAGSLPPSAMEANTCIYPTVCTAVALAASLHWGYLSGPKTPLPHTASEFTELFRDYGAAMVHTEGVYASISWTSEQIPGVLLPRGAAMTHLLLSDIGTVQCATPSLFLNQQSLLLPKQPEKSSLTPRIEFYEGGRWYSNLFDKKTKLTGFRLSPPKLVFEGRLCSPGGMPSNVTFELVYRFSEKGSVRKTLRLYGKSYYQTILVQEPFVKQRGWEHTSSANAVTFNTHRGSFRIRLAGMQPGVILEPIHSKENLYFPILPAVKCIPIQLRLTDPETSTVRWVIEKLPADSET